MSEVTFIEACDKNATERKLSTSNSSFWGLWTGQTVSQFGSLATSLSLVLWLQSLGASGKVVGLYFALSSLTSVVLSFFSGSIADRYDRKRIIITADLIACAVALAIAALYATNRSGGLTTIGMIIGLRLSLIACNTFRGQALATEIANSVPPDELKKANSLFGISRQLAGSCGEFFGSAIFALAGGILLFLGDSLTYVVAAFLTSLCLAAYRRPKKDTGPTDRSSGFKRVFADSIAGFSYVRRNKGLRELVLTVLFLNILYSPMSVWLPFFISNHLKVGKEWLGYLNASLGIGMLIGSVVAGFTKVEGDKQHLAVLASLVTIGALLTSMFFLSQAVIFIPLMTAIGICAGYFNIVVPTVIQSNTTPELRGRVFAFALMIGHFVSPLAQGTFGAMVDFAGSRVGLLALGSGVSIMLFAMTFFMKKSVRSYIAGGAL